jgi:hypothetical protein
MSSALEELPMQHNAQQAPQLISRHQFPSASAESTGELSSMRRRRAWVGSLEQLFDHASRYPPSQFPHPDSDVPLQLQTRLDLACRSTLRAIKDVLADHHQPVTAAALRQLKTFVGDPSASPLFGDNPYTAQHAARAPAKLHLPTVVMVLRRRPIRLGGDASSWEAVP